MLHKSEYPLFFQKKNVFLPVLLKENTKIYKGEVAVTFTRLSSEKEMTRFFIENKKKN